MMIPNCFYTKSLLKLIDELVTDGYKFENLSEADKDKLIAECINCLGEDAYSCILETENIGGLLNKYVSKRNKDDAFNLAETLRDSAIDYFNPTLEVLFEERSDNHKEILKIENGLFNHINRNTNETIWLKSA